MSPVRSALVATHLGCLCSYGLVPEGSFDACCVPADTGSHPLISDGLPGCPYRMASYLEEDIAEVDPAFGVQLHHSRFIECIGAPESAQLLGRSPAEWVQTMDKQDVMAAALQLQRDAGLMASNLQVLGQYVTSLRGDVGGAPISLRSETLPVGCGQRRGPGTPGALCSHPGDSYGLVATTDSCVIL